MRTTWTEWSPARMREDAQTEARVGFEALRAPERTALECLPYFGAFTDYRDHITGCADCIDDRRPDCAESENLVAVFRIGVAEQQILATLN
jgi:hypothetical protein